ncbi:hypothetical protein NW765_008221 [Fusarium oxysporum]|nr:hypothetical protein NW765_008221 [Fusarium oxysporum]
MVAMSMQEVGYADADNQTRKVEVADDLMLMGRRPQNPDTVGRCGFCGGAGSDFAPAPCLFRAANNPASSGDLFWWTVGRYRSQMRLAPLGFAELALQRVLCLARLGPGLEVGL